MIYVLNSKGEPLMPTVRHGRVRHLLRDKKAFIVNYHPFTVQLTKERSNEIQEVSLGIDTGYENIGLSATTKDKVLFESKAELRTDLVENLSTRRETRRTRRSRKLSIRSKVSTLGLLKFPRHCLLKNSISSFIRQRFIFQFVSVNTHISEQKFKVIFQINSMDFAGFVK